MLGLHCSVVFSLVAESRGCSLVVVRELPIELASLVEHGLSGVVVVARGLSYSSCSLVHWLNSCVTWA